MKSFAKSIFFSALMVLPLCAYAADGSSLKPPAGVKVAVVMFEDLECPSCAFNYPKVWDAANTHHVPVVLKDFPLGPSHPWSMEAAVWARFFDTQSEKMGEEFRGYIFRNQSAIYPSNLRQYVQKFADEKHVSVPFALDPGDKLKAKVTADHDLGVKIGITQTPTIFVVSNTESREVTQADQLGQIIEEVQRKAGPDNKPSTAKPATKTQKKKAS
jgi:protein-disulfide isomerase